MRLVPALVAAVSVALAAQGQPALVVDAPPALSGAADAVRGFDAARLDRALASAGLEMPPEIRVSLVPEDDPRAEGEPRWIVGLAFGDADIEIFPARVAGYPYDSLESVLRHEIVHLALDRRAGAGFLPRWFHEGVAEAVGSERGLADQWQLVRAMASAPTMGDLAARFQSDEENQTADAYRLAVALVDDIRRRHGADAPGRIAGRVAGGMPFDRAFLAETGETVEVAAAQAWGVYRRLSQWLALLSSGQSVWTFILLLAFVALAVQLRRRARQRRLWDELDGER